MPPSISPTLDHSAILPDASLPVMPLAKVLVVDSDPRFAETLCHVVRQAGHPAIAAHSATDALSRLKTDRCQIVILERDMPQIDGLVLCAAIRAARVLPGYVYIILRTSDDSERDSLIGLNAGADECVGKQTPNSQLIARLMTAQRILALEHSLRVTLEERTLWAMTDALTGVRNRRCLDLELKRELKIARRYGGDLSLVVIDVDHFKDINDRHGHAVGDDVLKELARRLEACLPRDTDWLARVGGEEFAAVLPQTKLRGAARVAEILREGIASQPVVTRAALIPVTVSLGVSGTQALAHHDVTGDELLQRADSRLYHSKREGRDRVSVDEPAARVGFAVG